VRIAALYALLVALLPGAAPALPVYAAGDIGECGADPRSSAAAATAALIPDGATVLVLGDSVYPRADRATLERCYGATWGARHARTFAVPGNHDYISGGAADFLEYFGSPRSGPTWFRAELDRWWLFGLDSNLRGAALAAQDAWLNQQLAEIAGDGRCVVAIWHRAFVSTGFHRGDGAPMRHAWSALARAGADLALAGHEHMYEAFAPRDARGNRARYGITEFVVGTGGARLADWSLEPWAHRAYARRYGVLALDLEPDRFRWRFIAVGGAVLDHGETACHHAQSR
jgi:acid phosphatase type 7